MRIELWLILITSFVLYNMYYDNKLFKWINASFHFYKKYYKMAIFVFLVVMFYYVYRTKPANLRHFAFYANQYANYLPFSKQNINALSPLMDLTQYQFMGALNSQGQLYPLYAYAMGNSLHHPLNSQQQQQGQLGPGQQQQGQVKVKRLVSETKKKYVASCQNWKCASCTKQLKHTFEVDHRVRLEQGGSNDVTNLVALCRECHGEKTAMEIMQLR